MPDTTGRGPDFRVLFEAVPGQFVVVDPDLVVVAASDAYLQAAMRRREELVGRMIFDVFPDNPDDPEASGVAEVSASFDRVRTRLTPETMAVQHYDVPGPDGRYETRYWSPMSCPVLDGEGRLAYIIQRVEDVTEFVQLSERNDQSEERTGALEHRAAQMEAEILARSRELGDANQALRAARNADRLAAEERERLEAQLHESQRLEGLGQLAGGVAHEFNNLLGVIKGYTAFVGEEVAAAAHRDSGRWQSVSDDVEQVRQAADRAAELVRQMLTFGRREVVQPRPVDLNQTVTDLTGLLGRILDEHTTLRTDLASGLPQIHADPGQLEQILVNLALNSRDAMPHGGTLTVTTRADYPDPALTVTSDPDGPGRGTVRLAVTDTGTGMDSDTAAHVFEPFFTTHPKATHSGLGLAVVYGIVGRYDGDVTIDTAEGAGTTVTATFPVVDTTVARPVDQPSPAEQLSGTETILAVDDEPAVLEIARRMLARHGYHVHTYTSGAQACDHARHYDGALDLLLTDVVMPDMHGQEVADQLRQLRPDIKILYMSGYDYQTLTHQGVLNPDVLLIAKPFQDATLAARIQAVLAGRP